MGQKKIFISHCYQNKEIADHLIDLLEQTGIPRASVFCSSVVGQGIRNCQELNSRIVLELQESDAIIFLISYDFLQSMYCVEELGIGWFLSQQGSTKCFYLVLPDTEARDLEGFVNCRIQKLTHVDSTNNEFSQFLQDFYEKVGTPLPNLIQITRSVNTFFQIISPHISAMKKNMSKRLDAPKKQNAKIKQLQRELRELREKQEGPNPPPSGNKA